MNVPVTSIIVSMALVIAITAFLKEQFTLEGKATKWTAVGVFTVVWGASYLTQLYPQFAPFMDFLNGLEVLLGALGTPAFMKYTARQFSTPESPNNAAIANGEAVTKSIIGEG